MRLYFAKVFKIFGRSPVYYWHWFLLFLFLILVLTVSFGVFKQRSVFQNAKREINVEIQPDIKIPSRSSLEEVLTVLRAKEDRFEEAKTKSLPTNP